MDKVLGGMGGGGGGGSVEYGAPQLMPWLQAPRANVSSYVMKDVIKNPNKYFKPMGMTQEEELAQEAILSAFQDPQAYQDQIETFLSPYRDIISQDINKQFESPQGMLAARASEAGAFGSSRHRGGQVDLERARLDALTSALQGQYNVAQGQMQQGIGNLLGFGGFQRDLDLQQRQAPIRGAESYTNLMVNPYVNATPYTPVTMKKDKGGGFLGNLLGEISPLYSGITGRGNALSNATSVLTGGFGGGGAGSFLGAMRTGLTGSGFSAGSLPGEIIGWK